MAQRESAAQESVGRQNEASLSERFSKALASIDRQAPTLTYLGLGCWIAWNTIAFSGSFWLHETDNSSIAENLMLVHLLACFVTLAAVALFSDRCSRWIAKNRTTLIGGVVACAGTLLLCNARAEVFGEAFPHAGLTVLFTSGCILSGAGTTMLFLCAAALFGTLAPHRALYRLAECTLFSIAVYFVLNGCPQPIAVAGFVVLPLLGAGLFCIRQRDVRGEKQVLSTPVKLTRKFWVLLLSIGLCSTALELIRAYVLISAPPYFSIGANVTSQLIEIPLMAGIMAAILLTKSRRDGFAKLYSVAACALTVLIVCIAMFSLNTPAIAAGAWVVCTCYNMVVWAMLYYLVYQWRAGALRIMALGNAALSGGTLVASLLAMAYQASHISDSAMRIIIAVIGLAVLVDVLFVFSEKQINGMLLPVDEGSEDATAGEGGAQGAAKQPGKWKLACEEVAKGAGLSVRETEVFLSLARGRTAQEIAEREVVSIYTVRAHTRSIYAKLDVHSKKELTALVQKHVDEG
ncbi:LuxR family transcriptional regulator [Senegalimassilia faecalis]|uniref:LuxR family transcriptional regulator n=1 Tax=Senegalimassilia faecalis TaxID=2509433 RepID=A0A4Q2K3I6_9ACTN|nr:helix-turn-helix transcriptional regulator [Senegalimassilia faecalis]RXZ54641.1 LuxR family transcriptional regulator [Senegalimassilia faecalis]